MTIYGSLTLSAGMNRAYTGNITFAATSTGKTLSFAGKAMANITVFNGVGGGWTLQDSWNNGIRAITLTAGSLDLNGKDVTTSQTVSISGSSARSLTMGGATLTCADWTATTVANLTFDAGTSVLRVTTYGTFQGGGLTYNEVQLVNAGAITVAGANTFASLIRTGTAVKTDSILFSANQTVTGTLTLSGNSSTNRIIAASYLKGTQRTLSAGVVSASNADFQDIAGAGTGDWDLSAISGLSGDAGGNTGITFTAPQTNFWVGGGGNWSAAAQWASSSGGGAGSGRVPLPQDGARFDADSFGGEGQTVAADMPRLGKDVDFTGVTNTPTVTLSLATSIFGSLTLGSLTLGTGTALLTFEGRGSHTLTSGGLTFEKSITLDAPGGTLALQDALTVMVTGVLTINRGTFDANNKNVTAGLIASSNAYPRTITMGSGVWSLAGTGTVWNFATVTNLTLNADSSVIKLINDSSTDKTFSGGGKTYYDLWNATLGTGKVIIAGSNRFNDFKIDTGRTVRFTAGTNQTVVSFTATGSAGNLITLESTGAAYTLTKTGGGNVSGDYLSVSNSNAAPASTWYAGDNSTDGGGNSGWTFTTPPPPGNRYWVGGTGNWSDSAHWAAGSGGGGGASVPSSSEKVYFDASSGGGIATVDAAAYCTDLDFTGYTGTFAGNQPLTVYGSLTLSALMGRTFNGVITFGAAEPGKTITLAGNTLASAVTFNGVGGGWTLQDAWNNGTGAITLLGGTLDTNGQPVTTTGIFSISGTFPRTLTLGGSTLTCGDWTATVVDNLTFTPGTSFLKVTTGGTFAGGGLSYNEVQLNNAGAIAVSGVNTFATFTRTGTAATTNAVTFSADQTVTGMLTLAGNSAIYRLLVNSSLKGTQRTLTAGAVSVSNADFQDIRGAGGGSWDLSAAAGGSGDAWGNSGITFTSAQTNYWVGGTGSWSAVAEWADASNGVAGSGRVPLPQDDARFDAFSFGGAGLTVTANLPRLGGNIDFTGVTNNPTYTLSTTASIYGSLTLDALTLGTGTTLLTFEGRGSHTLKSAGLTFDKPITLDAPGGTLTLQDDFTIGVTRTLTLNNGTFDANNKNVTAGLIASSNAYPRTITMGSGVWTLSGTGTVWNFATVTNLALNQDASVIKLSDDSAVDKTFSGGGKAYHDFWNATQGAGAVVIAGSNVFNEFRIDAGRTTRFTAGTTQTVSTFTATGSLGNVITLESSALSVFMLAKSGGGMVPLDYLTLSYAAASPAAAWYAGANSTDGGNNTGWTFTAAPMRPTAMLCEGQTNPNAVNDDTPEFSAIYNDPDPGDTADAYQVQVDDDSGFGSPLWDSGQTSMSNCTQGHRCQDISYGGPTPIATGTKWYWRVKFWDDGATEGDWSTNGDYFEMYAPPPDRYWIGGTGDWTDPAHWSTESGGSGGAAPPTFSEDVYFDGSSGGGVVTVNSAASCGDLDFTGFTGTFAGSQALTIYGSLTLGAGMTQTYTGAVNFAATAAGKTLMFNGIALGAPVTFNGAGGGWTLQDAWANGGGAITLTDGALDTNGRSVTTTGAFSISGASPRALALGGSTLTVGDWTAATATNLTFTPGSSILVVTTGGTFAGGGLTYNEVQLNNAGAIIVSGANTFATFTRTGTAATTNSVTFSADQTVTGTLTIAGNSAIYRVLVNSSVKGTQMTLTAGAVSVSRADFQDIRGAGAGSWDLSGATDGSGDAWGNSGITFTPAQTNYWVGGAGSWSSVGEWADASGGTGGTGRVPLPQDDARFDDQSFSGAGQTVTANLPRLGGDIDFTGVTNNPTYTLSTTASIYGSLTLDALTLGVGTTLLTFEGRGSHTLKSAGLTFEKPITLAAPGGSLTLQDDFSIGVTWTLTVNNGTFNAGSQNMTAGLMASNVATARTINMGSGVWNLTGAGTVWNLATVTNLTLDPGTSVLKLTDNSATNKTFAGGGKTYYDFWNATLGAGLVIIQGSNVFHDFRIDAGRTTQFTAGTNQTLSAFTAVGSLGNLITLQSTGLSQYTLTKAGGGAAVSCDYMHITYSNATPANTWYAGNNSTDNGNNAGWTFSVPLQPTALLTEGSTNPEEVSNETPAFSAVFNDAAPANTAINYQVQVDDDSAFGSPLWDSGKTAMSSCAQGTRCQDLTYGGTELEAETKWYWRIKFWDFGDVEGLWSSEDANFTMLRPGAVGVSPSGGGFLPF